MIHYILNGKKECNIDKIINASDYESSLVIQKGKREFKKIILKH